MGIYNAFTRQVPCREWTCRERARSSSSRRVPVVKASRAGCRDACQPGNGRRHWSWSGPPQSRPAGAVHSSLALRHCEFGLAERASSCVIPRSPGMIASMAAPDSVLDAVRAVLDGVPKATQVHELRTALNRASGRLVAWPDPGRPASEGPGGLPVEVVHDALAAAFMYDYFEPSARSGNPFRDGGFLNRAGEQWPPPLEAVPALIRGLWESYAGSYSAGRVGAGRWGGFAKAVR